MKIALAQLNFHIGDFSGNAEKMVQSIKKAEEVHADLIVFSELAVCGYPPRDLLERRDFIEKSEKAIREIAKHTAKIAVVVGAPFLNPNERGKNLFNSAFFIYREKTEFVQHKTLLPTYDIFDEYRYFEHNTDFNLLTFKGKKIAITVCEDLWEKQPMENSFAKEKLYTVSPIAELSKLKPDFLINISASPFSYSQDDTRTHLLSSIAKNYKLPLVYVNQIGAHAELIFDGDSKVFNAKGQLVKQLKVFEEDLQFIELESMVIPEKQEREKVICSIHDALVLGISDYFKKTGFSKATLGLSGGIDSAVTAVLAVRALGNNNVHVLLMPSDFSSEHSLTDAIALANNLKIHYEIVNIQPIFEHFQKGMKPIFRDLPFTLTEENIQARVRGTLLMALANKFNYILLNTSNKSETAVGYATLYGDMNGGLSVLGDVYKTKVFELAAFINKDGEVIPDNSISKPPSAELRPNQQDTDSLPDYNTLDKILCRYIEQCQSAEEIISAGFNAKTVRKIIHLVNINEYKRFQTPPILRITSKAFGFGRKIPLVAKH